MHDMESFENKKPFFDAKGEEECAFAKPKFDIGEALMSPQITKLAENMLLVELYLDRHQIGEWDDSDEDDQKLNLLAIESGQTIISRFNTPFGCIKVVTSQKRKQTLVMFDQEILELINEDL
jgi:hypothetical protein